MIVNDDKLKEYKTILEEYDGYLPYLILININRNNYFNNLRNASNYDDVQKEYYDFRIKHKKCGNEQELFEDDLREWYTDNKVQFKDIIKE